MTTAMTDTQHEPLFSRVIGLNGRLAIAVAVSATLMFVDARQGLMPSLRGGLAEVTAPLQWFLAQPFEAFGDANDFLIQHQALLRERQAQAHRQAILQAGQLTQAELRAENARLRAVLALPLPAGRQAIVAEAMVVPQGPFGRRMLLNRGAQAGIQAGAPVVDALGLVGQVTRVDATYSEVTTIVARQLQIPVQSARTGLRLLVQGMGSDWAIEIPQLDEHADLAVGDLLVTSGLDGVYPMGLPVARVQVIHPPKRGSPFASALARPVAGVGHSGPFLVFNLPAHAVPSP
ncbi:MAG: rod shape-determining protein MreC [Betaproteobacteria bacterium]|nr:MAG: rod shape-determining protein MreC [Betaproteobacteria bacterium]